MSLLQRSALLFLLVLSALAVANPANAAVRYVSPTGSASADGASPGAAWSMTRANAALVSGDVAIILPGTYSVSINPANSGSGITERITYVGSITNPGSAIVPSIQVNKAFVTVKGVKATGGLVLASPARFDSVSYCEFGALGLWGAKYCMVSRNTTTGDVRFLANAGLPCYSSQNLDPNCNTNCEYDTVRSNRINLGTILPGDRSFEFKAWTQHCLIDSNQVSGTFADGPLADGGIGMVSYNSYFQTFKDNRWEFEAASNHHNFPNTTWDAFYLRDSLHTTVFLRDTVLAGVNSPDPLSIRCTMSASGSFPGGVRDISLIDCVFRVKGDIYWQNGFKGWAIDGCVLQSEGGIPLNEMSDWVGSRLTHSTLWSTGQCMRIEGSSTGTRFKGTGNEISSNIFYSANAGALGNYGGVAMFKENTSGFTSNNNLFFTPNFTNSPGDRSLVWAGYYGSRPGAGQPWNNLTGQDGQSRYGSPTFVDSSWATFDPRLRAGSPAIGAGVGGSDAGAVPFSVAGADEAPPAAVVDLDISNVATSSLLLTWTAPGDDGNAGIATAYDLRRSTAPITAGDFVSATRMTPQPTPTLAGTAQSYVVTGLSGGTTYYFALLTRDEMGNWSPLSNLPSATTLVGDNIPPAAIIDLTATP